MQQPPCRISNEAGRLLIDTTGKEKPTFVVRSRSLVEYTLRTFAITFLPLCRPSHTSPNSPCDSGFPAGS